MTTPTKRLLLRDTADIGDIIVMILMVTTHRKEQLQSGYAETLMRQVGAMPKQMNHMIIGTQSKEE